MDIVAIKTIFLKYILLPLIVIILVLTLLYLKKKIPTIKTKVLVLYIVIFGLCMSLLGFFGFSSNSFSPYLYIIAMIIYLSLGYLNVNLLDKYFDLKDSNLFFTISFKTLVTITIMLWGGYLFYVIFNWMSIYEGYAFMAATSIFIFIVPLSFYYCYLQFINIPLDVYNVWQYVDDKKVIELDRISYKKLLVVNFELTKSISDGQKSRIKAKAPDQGISFGDWFSKVVSDYNFKNPNSTIQLNDETENPFNWIFYTKKSFFHFRKFIDFNESYLNNNIIDNSIIICKRVSNSDTNIETNIDK
jgi:hypothetical protein